MLVRAGTVVMLDRGERHYANLGPYRILHDFDEDRCVERFLAQWKPRPGISGIDKPSVGDFGDWLVSVGIAEGMEVLELDVDSKNSDRRIDKS